MKHKVWFGGTEILIDRLKAVPLYPRPSVTFGNRKDCLHPDPPKKLPPEQRALMDEGICWKCRGKGYTEEMTGGNEPDVLYTIRRHSHSEYVVVDCWGQSHTQPLSWEKVTKELKKIRKRETQSHN